MTASVINLKRLLKNIKKTTNNFKKVPDSIKFDYKSILYIS
jgi:hypothetical protein